MKSRAVHYMNKYPGGKVEFDENRLEAFDAQGVRRVSLRLTGNGQVIDAGKETGAKDAHDMSPIPKVTRAFKLYADGRVGKSEEYAERIVNAKRIAVDGKVLSETEYKALKAAADAEEARKAEEAEEARKATKASEETLELEN